MAANKRGGLTPRPPPITSEEARATVANGALSYWAAIQGAAGTNIHSCAEFRTSKGWRVAPGCLVTRKRGGFSLPYDLNYIFQTESWRIGRDYPLFTALCGVQGAYGGREHILRIAERPRGLPEDASDRARAFFAQAGVGWGRASYVTLAELENYNWDYPWIVGENLRDASNITIGASCQDFLDNILPKLQKLVPCSLHPDCRQAGPEMGILCSKRTSEDVRLLFSFSG
jgi:hypothetical protein